MSFLDGESTRLSNASDEPFLRDTLLPLCGAAIDVVIVVLSPYTRTVDTIAILVLVLCLVCACVCMCLQAQFHR
jgi:hypothetical protein